MKPFLLRILEENQHFLTVLFLAHCLDRISWPPTTIQLRISLLELLYHFVLQKMDLLCELDNCAFMLYHLV